MTPAERQVLDQAATSLAELMRETAKTMIAICNLLAADDRPKPGPIRPIATTKEGS